MKTILVTVKILTIIALLTIMAWMINLKCTKNNAKPERVSMSSEYVDTVYGCYLDIRLDSTALKIIENTRNINARKHVDVFVKYNGIKKEFTLQEFLERLGY